MGVGFGINYPMLFSALGHRTGDLLSGKVVRGEAPAHIKTADEMQLEAVQNRAMSETQPLRITGATPQLRISNAVAFDRLQTAKKQLNA